MTQPRREACVYFAGQQQAKTAEQTKPHLKDDGEEARKEDYEEQLVAELRPRLQVDSPITPNGD